jgi:hypothetical protein
MSSSSVTASHGRSALRRAFNSAIWGSHYQITLESAGANKAQLSCLPNAGLCVCGTLSALDDTMEDELTRTFELALADSGEIDITLLEALLSLVHDSREHAVKQRRHNARIADIDIALLGIMETIAAMHRFDHCWSEQMSKLTLSPHTGRWPTRARKLASANPNPTACAADEESERER